MGFDWKHGLAACLAIGSVAGGSVAQAQDGADPFAAPGSRVSGSLSFDYYTHFISYGYDVWSGGDSWSGDSNTFNPSASINIALTENMNLFTGAWADVNNNTASGDALIGGQLQEVDVWVGIDYTIDKFTVSLTGQQWIYGGGVEDVIDIGLSFDDSEWLGDWAMSPSLTIHWSGDAEGFAYVFGVSPGFTLNADGTYPIDITIPANLAFGDDDFYGDGGFAFVSIGAQASIPLAFIDESYGAWSLNFGITYYHTDDDAIGNPDDDFFVGNVGVGLAF